MSLTSMLMLPTAFFGFVGTLWYGYVTNPMMTQVEALGLVCIAVVVALVAEFSLAGVSIFINEVVFGM